MFPGTLIASRFRGAQKGESWQERQREENPHDAEVAEVNIKV
jgi:hypothetical protein